MTGASNGKRDFFISFTGTDQPWARWLARVLHEEGYTSCWRDQDFAGSISRNIEEAHTSTKRTILLLSEAYAKSGYCRSEWDMRWQEDTGGEKDLLILFRLGDCEPPLLLKRLAYEDLFTCSNEDAARELVCQRLRKAADPTYRRSLGNAPFPLREAAPFPPHNLSQPNQAFIGRMAELDSSLINLWNCAFRAWTRLYQWIVGAAGKAPANMGYTPITQSQALTNLDGTSKGQAPFTHLQALSKGGKIISKWSPGDEKDKCAAEGVQKAFDEIQVQPLAGPPPLRLDEAVGKNNLHNRQPSDMELKIQIEEVLKTIVFWKENKWLDEDVSKELQREAGIEYIRRQIRHDTSK